MLRNVVALPVYFSISMVLSGCATSPSFVFNKDASPIKSEDGKVLSDNTVSDPSPVGPKVASLVANLKCELHRAATSKKMLPFYKDSPHLITKNHYSDELNRFSLANIFSEIEYIAQAQFTLDVTDGSGVNPLGVFTNPYTVAAGLNPATNLVLSVAGKISESPHRFIQIYQAIDFSRLIDPRVRLSSDRIGVANTDCLDNNDANVARTELQGDLGLEETLAAGIIAETMSDIAVFPTNLSEDKPHVDGIIGAIPISTTNIFGQISTQIDFTIVEGINGGPAWTLRRFKGPGGGSNSLIDFNRQVKDTMLITFVPVCVRMLGSPVKDKSDHIIRYDYKKQNNGNIDKPQDVTLADGTPGWANYLPPCYNEDGRNPKASQYNSSVIGRSVNNILQITPH